MLSSLPHPSCDIMMTVLRDTKVSPQGSCFGRESFFQPNVPGRSKCYHVQTATRTQSWHEAAEYCQSLDANLTTIDNAKELHLLQHVMQRASENEDLMVYGNVLYLGLHREVGKSLLTVVIRL